MSVPWWLNPWREARRLRQSAEGYEQRIDDLCHTTQMDIETIAELEREIRSLRGKLAAAVTDARTSGAALVTGTPDFVMVGTPRQGGKRLQVSRDITVTAFAMTEIDDPPPRWKIGAIMEQLLVIDKPTYSECLAHLATIWANWDRDAAA